MGLSEDRSEFPPGVELSVRRKEPFLWVNDTWRPLLGADPADLSAGIRQVKDADARYRSFADLLGRLFPELSSTAGIIDSQLYDADRLRDAMLPLESRRGRWFLKADHALPVAGSIKARGGVYEVLMHAENLALAESLLMPSDNRLVLASPEVRRFFSQYRIAVGSTGNLGLSIGVTAAALGFKATVHMSAEAKEWKKERLRSRGVEVIEHAGDFGEAVAAGRIQAKADSRTYFIDDEYSEKLFLGYSVAALNLSNQLASLRIEVDEKHPLLVYVPCGVGGAPGGITFGLRHVFGDNVHCFFAEPVASPCMLIRLANSNNHLLSVRDLGLDNETEADGLAVARASEFVAPRIKTLVSGIFTVTDNQLFSDLYVLEKTLGLRIEPSAAAGIRGPNWLLGSKEGHRYTKLRGLAEHMDDSTHVVWTTGGLFMPDEIYGHYRERGRVVHSSGVAGPGHSDLGMFELR